MSTEFGWFLAFFTLIPAFAAFIILLICALDRDNCQAKPPIRKNREDGR